MKIDTTKYTYEALLAYACYRGDQEFSETHARLTEWFERMAGLILSTRTLSRHVQILASTGRIQVTYSCKGRAVYRFPDGVVTRQRVKFLPTLTPGQFTIEDDGVDVLHDDTSEAAEQTHKRVVMASLGDLDLDRLQASWA